MATDVYGPTTTASQRRRASDDVVMFQGQPLTHDRMVKLYQSGADQKKDSRALIVKCRDIQRQTLKVTIAQSWALKHPEIAATAVEILPERQGYLDILKAATGAVEPLYDREALGYLDSDRDAAKDCRSYMNTWYSRNVPYQTFNGKASEDGQYMVTVLPTDVDMDGRPDFYDTLDQDAWDALSDEDKAAYTEDKTSRKKKRYAKFDGAGRKQPAARWDRNARGQTRSQHEGDAKRAPASAWERDDAKSSEAHQEAVRRYLLSLDQEATTVRVIPALDVAPFFRRSTDNKRWELFAAVERSLVYPEDLQQDYGWEGMGNRALIPTGYDATRTTGQYGQFYLYTAYIVHTDKRRKRRPIIAYSVGGHPTWTNDSGPPAPSGDTCALLDLYESHGLEGPRWFYSGGMYSNDDSPDYCWRPALAPIADLILSIETIKTSINCAIAANAYTGYWHIPDAGLAAVDPEAMVDADRNLVIPAMPAPGETATALGQVVPASAAQLGPDAWKNYEAGLAALHEATAIDKATGDASTSARSLVVQQTIGQQAKRQIREGNLYSVIRAGELHLETLSAIEKQFGVRWPIHTTQERTIGSEVREAIDHVEFDPKWVGPDNNCRLIADYPEERNLAWIDLVQSGYNAPKPTRSLRDVARAYGDEDEMRLRMEMAEDAIWAMPQTMQALQLQVAQGQGNPLMLKVLKLQADQQLTKQGAPGFQMGLPTAALQGPGEGAPPSQPLGPTQASASLGGQVAAGRETGPQMAEGRAQIAAGQAA